ncbi:MAG TPA: tRNA preQ1(34) S-adenosylmethionine ribosyltransferase-isomerase QueA [Candidatus Limnocylindrales bacterium]|nr:tRNA preQ1(34) S-adenosylmethionine ribosyltransferase-isomerase QueA [Candidatus Limnocylindrales bacterium]
MNRPVPAEHDGPFWTGELDYRLPEQSIAQVPAERREDSRLMVLDRTREGALHSRFSDIARFIPDGALLVANDSKVVPARLRGRKLETGGVVEALVLATASDNVASAMIRVAKPLREGQTIELEEGVTARVVSAPEHGRALLDFSPRSVAEVLERCGEIPLPPYIERSAGPTPGDIERYQTVYARRPGSVAAPTAGLHFTPELLAGLERSGFEFATITLHVGPGTFTPVRGSLSTHTMEEERFEISEDVAARIASARAAGRPVVAIGTTTVRALESAASPNGDVTAGEGTSSLFIQPGYRFRIVDALVTNFHLPGSTLLALVMALAGRDRIRRAYETAVAEGYRFYSYGDAMLIR